MTRKSLQHQLDELRAVDIVMSARISALENLCVELCAKFKHKSPPLITDTGWMPVKMAAHELQMTVPGVHALVRRKKLRRRPGGLPVLIDAKTVYFYKKLKSNRPV